MDFLNYRKIIEWIGKFKNDERIKWKNSNISTCKYIMKEMHGSKECLHQCKKKGHLILKSPLEIFIMQMLKKNPFYKNVSDSTYFLQDLGLFFFRTISWGFIGSPQNILRKMSRETKTHDNISSDILS